jgi:hypothetical protein
MLTDHKNRFFLNFWEIKYFFFCAFKNITFKDGQENEDWKATPR